MALLLLFAGFALAAAAVQWARLGPDSLAVVVLYALGIVGLAFVTQ